MQYKIRRVGSDKNYIIHGAEKGSTWDNHLYIARQKLADGWRYFYSQAELRAAQAKQAGRTMLNKAKNKANNFVNQHPGIRSAASNMKNRSTALATRAKNKATNFVNSHQGIKSGVDRVSSGAHKVKNVLIGQYAKASDLINKAPNAIKNGSDMVKKALSNPKKVYDEATQRAAEKGRELYEGAKKTASEAKDTVKSAIERASQYDIKEEIDKTKQNMTENIRNATKEARSIFTDYTDNAKQAAEEVIKKIEFKNNYRKAATEADRAGRETDILSDRAEDALLEYGRDSEEYKKAYDEMEASFERLALAEAELAKYENQKEYEDKKGNK